MKSEDSGIQPVGRFPSAQRVRRRAEFRAVQTNGRRVRTPHFVLLLYARRAVDAASPPRLGIVASRKIGNAVQRNRAKRLIREAFRATRPLWPSGMDVVVIVTRPVEKKLTEVVNEWRTAEPRVREQCRQARADAEARAARGED